MIKEIEDLKVQAYKLGETAGKIHDRLMNGIELPYIKRHELEIEMYSLRLKQAELNLKFHQVLAWAKEQRKILC